MKRLVQIFKGSKSRSVLDPFLDLILFRKKEIGTFFLLDLLIDFSAIIGIGRVDILIDPFLDLIVLRKKKSVFLLDLLIDFSAIIRIGDNSVFVYLLTISNADIGF